MDKVRLKSNEWIMLTKSLPVTLKGLFIDGVIGLTLYDQSTRVLWVQQMTKEHQDGLQLYLNIRNVFSPSVTPQLKDYIAT